MQSARLDSLTGLYVAGSLSAGEHDELYRILLSSPAARERFDRLIRSHGANGHQVAFPTAIDFLHGYVPQANIVPLGVPLEEPAPQELQPNFAEMLRLSIRAWRYWTIGGALVTFLLAGMLVYVHGRTRPLQAFEAPTQLSTGVVATLTHAANVEWLGTTNELFLGDTFGATELNIAAGVFEVEFKKGARLIVEGPAQLQLISDNEAFLRSGKVTAHVPDPAHGFKITAPMAAITDLGTEFGLRADATGPAEVHVFDGAIEMARPNATSAKRMTQGEGMRIQGRSARKVSASRSSFIFGEDVQTLEKQEMRARLEKWKQAARVMSHDPATLVHYTFEEGDDMSVRLANAAVNAPRGSTGTISGTWSDGRWPDKRGITLNSKADRIRFNVPNTMTSLTYMAWLRVDKLTSVSNALAVTESGELGEVHWQIYRDGRVALSSHSGKGAGPDESWDRGLSPTIFAGDRLGKWTHLTSVYDISTRTISHYVDGEFVSSTPIKRPLRLKLGAVEIGNWGVNVDESRRSLTHSAGTEYYNRHWSGCVDEFALLSRAMTPSEIRNYYRQGRVAAGTIMAQNDP